MKFVVCSFLKYIYTIFSFQNNFPRKPLLDKIHAIFFNAISLKISDASDISQVMNFFKPTNLRSTSKYLLITNDVLLLVFEWGFRAKTRLSYTHCWDKSQRRTAGCNKVYFSRYYVKLASLAELELFKKHSAAVVAVGSLNMHGGKCPRPPNPSPTFINQPAAPSRFSLPQTATFPAHAIILAHLRTLRSAVGTTVRLIFLLPVCLCRRFCDFRET